jgi:hypothetical protein
MTHSIRHWRIGPGRFAAAGISERIEAGAGCSVDRLPWHALAGICVPVVFDYRWRPTGAHADDELVVETAVNRHADALVTFNLRDMRNAAASFGFAVLRPGPLLRRMRP